MAKITANKFTTKVSKMGDRRIIAVPANLEDFEPGTEVEVKKK